MEARKDQYVIVVRDNGPGIAPQNHIKIFQRFFRVDAAYRGLKLQDQHTSGAGLGLSIALSIAETHRGSLHLESSDERGSVFIATVPQSQFADSSTTRD
jgi:signal transduction histidine kinase